MENIELPKRKLFQGRQTESRDDRDIARVLRLSPDDRRDITERDLVHDIVSYDPGQA